MKIKFLSVFFFSYLTIFSQDYLDNEIYIKYRQNPSTSDISLVRTSLESYSLQTMEKTFRSPELQTIYTITFQSKVDLEAIIERLQALAMIEYAEKVPLHRLFYTPNDPQYTSQWNLSKILASQAWNIHQGSAAIKIAITDNGFLLTHQDLVNKWAINTADNNNNGADDDGNGYVDDWRGWDAADNDNDPSVPASTTATIWSHGSHVAGISAGETNNSLGIASIGFNCKLIPVKIGQSSTGWLTGAIRGVEYAIAVGADVINMSWGGGPYSKTEELVFVLARNKGILCVAAAGNNSSSSPMYPASYNHVISVAATGTTGSSTSDAKAWFSNYGSTIDVSAPGVDIKSALHTGTSAYGLMDGTSMASPLVAGLVGLMKSYNPAPIDTIEACLKRTCDNINGVNSAYIGQLGAGRVNALQALQCLSKKPVSLIEVLDTFQCVGQVVRYQAKSFGAPTLSYAWTFPGGNPLTSTQPNPLVTYGSNGWKSATLITSNSYGSDTITINNLVRIDSPRAYLNGNRYTIFSSIPVMIPIRFSGNPPYTVTLTDGTNTWTQSGITSNPYYFQITPQKDTSYITISAYSDKSCVGAKYGMDTIYRRTGMPSTSICNDSTEINSAQSGWQALNTSGTWGSLSSCNYVTSIFTANASNFPGMTSGDCLWGPIVQNLSRTYYNSSSNTTTSSANANIAVFRKQLNIPQGAIIDSVRIWMLSDDFVDSVFLNNKMIYTAPIPIVYGQVLFTKKDSLVGIANSQNYLTIKAGNLGGYYGHYFRAKVYYSYLCDTPSNCDTNNLNNGLIINMPFDGNMNDNSGNGYNATNNGATLTTGRTGIANTAYKFNGTSNYMKINNIPISIDTNWTISFWSRLYNYQLADVMMEFINSNNSCNGNVHLYQYNGNVYNAKCGASYSSLWGLIGDTTSLQNSFHHIVLTKKNDTVKIYRDCNLISTVVTSYNNSSLSNISFGGPLNTNFSSQLAQMDLDDFRLYNRALSTNEMKALGGCCNSPNIPILKASACKNDSIQFYTDSIYWTSLQNSIGQPTGIKSKIIIYQYNSDPNITQAKWISSQNNWIYYGTAGSDDSMVHQYKFKTVQNDSIRFRFKFYRDNYAKIKLDNSKLLFIESPISSVTNYNGTWVDTTVFLNSGIHSLDFTIYNHNTYSGANGFGFMTAGYISSKRNVVNCDTPTSCNDTLGLVLCMSMNGHTQDSTKYNNHGTIVGGVSSTTDRMGNANSAYSFNGSNGYIQVSDALSLKATNQLTIALWANQSAVNTTTGSRIVDKITATTGDGYLLDNYGNPYSGRQMRFVTQNSTIASQAYAKSPFPINSWVHLAVTYSSGLVSYYINGILDTSYQETLTSLTVNSLPLRIGASNPLISSLYYNGKMDDLKIYKRQLSASEIYSLYTRPFRCLCQGEQTTPINCTQPRKYSYTKCSIDSIQLSARQGSQYVWSPNIELSSNVIQNPICYATSSRIYYVLYTDTAGCQIVDTFDIKVRTPKFYSPLSDETICNGDSVQISIPIYATNIQWSPPVDISNTSVRSPYFFPSVSRTYYLKFIDSMGCPHWDTIQINVKACCDARARFVLSDSVVCFGIHPRIYNTSKGNINFYNWTFGTAIPNATNAANPPIITFPATGHYPIRLIVGNASCRDTMDKNIYIIGVRAYAGRDTYNCVNPLVVKLGGSTMGMQNYSWTPMTGLDDPNISNPTATLTNTSVSYIVEVTDMFSNCTSYDTVVVSNLNAVISLNEVRKICQGDSTYFNGKYYKNIGIYRDTVRRRSLNCDSIISSFTLTHLVPDSLKYAMQYYCNRYVDAKGKVWTDDLTLRDTIDSKQGCDSLYRIFPIKVTKPTFADKLIEACNEKLYRSRRYTSSKDKVDSTILKSKVSNCDSIITYTNIIIHSNPDAKIISDKKNPVKFEDKVTLEASGGVKYEWQPGGMTTEKIIYNVLDTASKTFIVKVIDTNKCWDTASYTIYVLLPDSCFVGIPNAFSPNNDNRNDIFIPNLSACAKIITFKIYNRWGEKVFETDRNEGWDGWYKGEMQGIGVYMYYIEIQTIFGKREFKNTFSLVR